ncbi:MAG: hypothetical protein KME64_20475 [Scytonematopsis contorta HA4267-MV1]|jgi:hypothetical protein|nr:hypothetical protein [Scytonematopsis contorta HA4267-MV1]
MKFLAFLRVSDWQTQQHFQLPVQGKDNWTKWLTNKGYERIERVKLGNSGIDLYKSKKENLYAVCCPKLALFYTESIYINIPQEKDARLFFSTIKQMLEALL